MKVVINACYGGFSLSLLGQREYAKRKGFELFFYKQTKYQFSDRKKEYTRIDDVKEKNLFHFSLKKDLGKIVDKLLDEHDIWFSDRDIPRDDEDLIAVIEKLGSKLVSGSCAELKIVEIPDWLR